jgi:hypothetical protein
MVRSELDLWYEMWDRAGSQGLDTWYELPGRIWGEKGFAGASDAEGLGEVVSLPPRPFGSGCEGE